MYNEKQVILWGMGNLATELDNFSSRLISDRLKCALGN